MADNIKVKNIYYMLSYAYQTLSEKGFDNVEGEKFENIHDLFAAILVIGVRKQVKRGLHKDYINKEESLTTLRGKICLTDSIKHQTFIHRQLVCTYDEFIEDTHHNQILKSTMLLLLTKGTVKKNNKEALRKILLYFSNVTNIAPSTIEWNSLKYHRNNATYIMLINICLLVTKGLLQTNQKGSYTLKNWLGDEHMYKLYEKFVLSYYIKEFPQYLPCSSGVKWNLIDSTDEKFLPAMKTDITLTKGEKIIIIDTKWYRHTMNINRQYENNKTTFISANLYQIFAYVKNKDKNSTGNVAGVLLYAKTDEAITPNNEFNIGGNKISLKTLDLNSDWNNITTQLENICLWLEKT